jgi:PAS domain S-box-containing protein
MTQIPDPTPDETKSLSTLLTEVRETELRFQSTFEQAAVGMAHVALDGRWLQVNQKLCTILGYGRQELLSRSFQDMTYADDLQENWDYIKRLVAGDIESYSMEKRYIRKDGSLIWANLTATLARDKSGDPHYFISVIEDINQRKQLEENLRQQQITFQAVAENAPDVIARFNREYRYIYVNPAVIKTSGKPPTEFIGKTHREAGMTEDYAQMWKGYLDNVFSSQQIQVEEFAFDGPNGQRFYQVRLTPEFDANGTVTSILSIARDFTEHKRLEIERGRSLILEKNARAEAEAERKRLYNLFMQVPALIALLNGPEHIFEFANQPYLQLSGNRDIIGKPVLEAFPEAGGEHLYKLLDQVYTTGKAIVGNEVMTTIDRHNNGKLEECFFNFVYQPSYNENGVVDAILVHAVEVTEQILAREHLKASQERLELSQRTGHVGTFEWIILKNEIIWTPELEALYGLPGGGFEGKYENWAQRVHPDDLPHTEANLLAATNGGPAYNIEFRVVWPDGSSRWMLGKGEVVEYVDGQASRLIGVNIDITERKEAELQLARTLEQVKFLATAGKLLVSALDFQDILEQVVKQAIPAFADWCRIDLYSEQGNTLRQSISYPQTDLSSETNMKSEAIQGENKSPAITAITSAHQQKKSVLHFHLAPNELQTLTTDAQEQVLLHSLDATSAMIIPLIVQDHNHGTITLVSAATRGPYTLADLNIGEELASRIGMAIERAQIYHNLQDLNSNLENRVTQRTEELNLLNAELERSNQELQEFAYVASHDLQEPLRKIQAFGNLLQEEYAPELGDGTEYIDRMRNAATRMRVLIDDLLTFSRVATKTLPFAPVNLATIAQDVIDDLDTRLQETHGKVEIEPLPTIDADPRQMYQILQNLIGNALKFHRLDVIPIIKVSARLQDSPSMDEGLTRQQCVLTVEDNGIGFDEKYLDKIFTVFQRLHGRNEYAGTGIGLAVVRKIVERHGGHVTATSKLGTGSTFIVTLPVSHSTKVEML